MRTVLNQHGVDLARINYQDNGNWNFQFHLHLYGRAKSAVLQPWGTALRFPATGKLFLQEMGDLEPLTSEDVAGIRADMDRLYTEPKYAVSHEDIVR